MNAMTIKIGTIKEWKKENLDVYKKIIEKNRLYSVDDCNWYEFIIDEYTRELEYIGFHDVKFQFAGFYSQGDGASFSGEWSSGKAWKNAQESDIEKPAIGSIKKLAEILDRIGKNHEWEFSIIRRDFRYSHENTVSINHSAFFLVSGQTYQNIGEYLENAIESSARDVMRDIYSVLEKEHNYQTSDEQIEEILSLNEYKFDADGKTR